MLHERSLRTLNIVTGNNTFCATRISRPEPIIIDFVQQGNALARYDGQIIALCTLKTVCEHACTYVYSAVASPRPPESAAESTLAAPAGLCMGYEDGVVLVVSIIMVLVARISDG